MSYFVMTLFERLLVMESPLNLFGLSLQMTHQFLLFADLRLDEHLSHVMSLSELFVSSGRAILCSKILHGHVMVFLPSHVQLGLHVV